MTYRIIFKALTMGTFLGAVLSINSPGTALNNHLQEVKPPEEHPFLIVKKEQFPALRARAEEAPWQSMKTDAIQKSDAGFNDSGNGRALHQYIGATALAYILDEDRKQLHANRVRDAILNELDPLPYEENFGDHSWGTVVPVMGAAFVAILSLDIVYNDLTPKEITQCENKIASKLNMVPREGAWPMARYGTHGTWDIYRGVRTTPDEMYYERLMNQMTVDGVTQTATHYAFGRVGSDDSRPQKSAYMDVLEFTGIDNRYYDNPKMEKFYRWLYGQSPTPNGELHLIGDTSPTQDIGNQVLHWKAGNYDHQAAQYAAYLFRDLQPEGHILSYIIPRDKLPQPELPRSKNFADGGGWFREYRDDPEALSAVLYNITGQPNWHVHEETNGLALSAYENNVLVSGGRLGPIVWKAPRNNVLTINGQDHDSKLGAGLAAGLTAEGFDYARGLDGPAIKDADWQRSLLFIHSTTEAPGYYLVMDEAEAQPGDDIQSYLHPSTESDVAVTAENQEYIATVDHYETVPGTSLSIFYATPPASVDIEPVASAIRERYPDYGAHRRLQGNFTTGDDGHKQMITVLFPFTGDHPKAQMHRITGNGYEGTTIARDNNGVTDHFVASTGEGAVSYEGISFEGKSLFHREQGSTIAYYFSQQATSLSLANTSMQSTQPVSVWMKEEQGKISVTADTEVTLKMNDLEAVLVNGVRHEGSKGQVNFNLTQGMHDLEMVGP